MQKGKNFTKIKIDFVAGSHGNFLERIISRFVLNDPVYADDNWFTNNGNSHGTWHSDFNNRPVQAWHWSGKKLSYNPGEQVIRIVVPSKLYPLVLINHYARTNGNNINLGELAQDTESQLLACEQGRQLLASLQADIGNKSVYTVQELESLFIHKITQFSHDWQPCNNSCYDFAFENFFCYDTFIAELNSVACFLSKTFEPTDSLEQIYTEFLEKNQGYRSWVRVQENSNLDWFEQLWKQLLESGQLN